LRTLDAFGFEWDGPVWYQSQRSAAYEAAFERLRRDGLVYECSCSRRDLQQLAQALGATDQDIEGVHYPGFCRAGPLAPERGTATRFKVREEDVCFEDGIQGPIVINVAEESGDFVVRRRDGLFAYQLACAVDDAAQGFTHVVRGADLIASTARQILLQEAFGYPRPMYEHLPVIVDVSGRKLAKSSTAPAVDTAAAGRALWQALRHLQQGPPDPLESASVDELWRWARAHWTPEPLKGRRTVQLRTENDAREARDVSLHGLGARERLD
jgi:glutamyl-Q tRNA(Asp) synthetase